MFPQVDGSQRDPRVLGCHRYTNKGKISSNVNKRIDVSLRLVAHRDSIGSVHELIFNNQSTA